MRCEPGQWTSCSFQDSSMQTQHRLVLTASQHCGPGSSLSLEAGVGSVITGASMLEPWENPPALSSMLSVLGSVWQLLRRPLCTQRHSQGHTLIMASFFSVSHSLFPLLLPGIPQLHAPPAQVPSQALSSE